MIICPMHEARHYISFCVQTENGVVQCFNSLIWDKHVYLKIASSQFWRTDEHHFIPVANLDAPSPLV